ncbi:hypothetical protein FOL46_001768, partial [Perkinsus olseni]
YRALNKFFLSRPEYNTRVFLAGQSYAGHYIPPLAVKLKQRNSRVRLEGIILGNAEVAPEIHDLIFLAAVMRHLIAPTKCRILHTTISPPIVTAFLNSHRARRFFGHDSLWQPASTE